MCIDSNTSAEESFNAMRIYRGCRTRWRYHDQCDDGHAGGEGHMQIVERDGGFVYRCRTCGYEEPYDGVTPE